MKTALIPWSLQKAAHAAVCDAVASGRLPPPSRSFCYDCGEPATQYDHRDYLKQLEVQPVCRSCNSKRGSAANNDAPDSNGLVGQGYGALEQNAPVVGFGTGYERPPSEFIDEYWTTWEPDAELEKVHRELVLLDKAKRKKAMPQRSVIPGAFKSFQRGLYDWFGVEPL